MDRSSSIFLTKREVDAAKAREGRYHLWDTKLAGFGLRVETSGTKTFVCATELTVEGALPRGGL
jgi:hypothetical protein